MRGLKVWIGGVMLSMLVGCMVAGRDADIADWPGMASLQSVSGRNVYHECGATVIAPDWALTAAHCVENVRIETSGRAAQYITDEAGRLARAGTLALGVGLADLSEIPPAAVHAITQVRLHPDYQTGAPELGNDIALLKLERSWQGALMPLAGLTAPEQDVYAPYAEVLAAGYGKKGEAARDEQAIVRGARHVLAPSLILQEGYVPPVEPQLCHRQIKAKLESLGLGEAYRDVRIEAATQICAGIGHSDACQGDSGGPLIQRAGMNNPVQVGVVSWGIGCGRLETPGIYMRASAYAGWISEITGQPLPLPVEEVAAGLAPVEETTGNLAEMLEETGSSEKSADDP